VSEGRYLEEKKQVHSRTQNPKEHQYLNYEYAKRKAHTKNERKMYLERLVENWEKNISWTQEESHKMK
jgi:hypothetical protein